MINLFKNDLVRFANQRTGVAMCRIDEAIEIVVDAIIEAMREGEEVQLRGFGTFGTKTRAPRTARNPQTNEEIKLPETVIPWFSPGTYMKEAVREHQDSLKKK